MKKYILILLMVFQALIPRLVHAQPLLYMEVEKFTCEGDHYHVLFGVINKYTYNQDVTIAFKVIRDEAVIGCNSTSMMIPAGSDGSIMHEISINVPCNNDETNTALKTVLFPRDQKNRVNFWLSECPNN